MVLCIEPTLEYEPGKIVLHEETVVVTEGKPQLLTLRAPKQLVQIAGVLGFRPKLCSAACS
ncbi:hypothetical protein NKH17_28000 [Mesorhizobium sp. M1334]